MYINSPGGSVTAGLGIYDTMQYISPQVVTWCVGRAYSMGAFLLAAGAPGHRYSLPNSNIMIHQPRGSAEVSHVIVMCKSCDRYRVKLPILLYKLRRY